MSEYYYSTVTEKDAIKDIVGATVLKVDGLNVGSEEIRIHTDKGIYVMLHVADCCESVQVDDIIGELKIGSVIQEFIEKTNSDIPKEQEYQDESFTWTFYTIKTDKGYCDIKWYGESNGYYSETAYFYKVNKETKNEF